MQATAASERGQTQQPRQGGACRHAGQRGRVLTAGRMREQVIYPHTFPEPPGFWLSPDPHAGTSMPRLHTNTKPVSHAPLPITHASPLALALASLKCISALSQFWCRRSTMPLFSCTLPLRQHTCRRAGRRGMLTGRRSDQISNQCSEHAAWNSPSMPLYSGRSSGCMRAQPTFCAERKSRSSSRQSSFRSTVLPA